MALSPAADTRRHPFAIRGACFAPAALAVLLGACDSPTEAAFPEVISIAAAEVAPLVGLLEVTLRSPAAITVDYWTAGSPRLRIQAPAAVTHSVTLTRLRAGRTYQYEIVESGHTGVLDARPLPEDLAAVTFTATGVPTVELVLVHLFHPDGFRGYAVVDAAGDVVWYWRTVDFPFGATRRESGTFVLMDKGRGLLEVDATGQVVNELPQDLTQRELHHDVTATPWNTILFLAYDDRIFNGATLRGEAIWEWAPETESVVRRWTSWDHLDPAVDQGPRFDTEWLHANSLAVGPRDNVLVSLHYLNQVISIAPDWNSLEWRLGGVNATIPVAANARFSGQHTARELPSGRIVLFDNGRDRGDFSRALELEVSGGIGTVAWEWGPTPLNYTSAVSSARRLANGNTLVGFGLAQGIGGSSGPTEFFEVEEGGELLWRVVVGGTNVMFRAEPIATLAGEMVVNPQ
jgi:hypothetical protein